jgi:hypothetical protein
MTTANSNILGAVVGPPNTIPQPPRLFVEMDFLRAPTQDHTAPEEWRRVTKFVRKFQISKGRKTRLGRAETGTCQLTLDNTDRRFEPGFIGQIGNYIQNPSLEENNDGWTALGGAGVDNASGNGRFGDNSRSIWRADAGPAQAGDGARVVNVDGSRIPVTPSALWTLSAYGYADATLFPLVWKMQILEYNAAGTLIQTTDGASAAAAVYYDWERRSMSVTTQATTVTVACQFVIVSVGGSGEIYAGLTIDAAQLQPGPLTGYVDGTLDGRWAGTAHASVTYKTGPYHPIKPLRRVRITAVRGNPVEDPTFERSYNTISNDVTSPNGWLRQIGGSGSVAIVTSPAPPFGTRLLEATFPVGSSAGARTAPRYRIPVEPGDTIIASAYLRKSVGSPALDVDIIVTQQNRKGVSVGSQTSTPTYGVDPPSGSWQRYQTSPLVIDDEATTIELSISSGSAASNAVFYISSVQVDYGGAVSDFNIGGLNRRFEGYMENFPQESPSHRRGLITVRAFDGFGPLANGDYIDSPPSEGSTARIGRVLDTAGWPLYLRTLDAGTKTLAAQTDVKEKYLEHLLKVAETELGLLYVDGWGRVVFHDANHRTTAVRSTRVQHVFGDGVVGANANADPSFEENVNEMLTFSDGGTPTLSRVTTDSVDGIASAQIVNTGTHTVHLLYSNLKVIPVKVGDVLRISGWVKAVTSGATNANVIARMLKADGTYLTDVGAAGVTPTTGQWHFVTGDVVVPAGAAFASVSGIVTWPSGSNRTSRYDNLQIAPLTAVRELPFLPSILPDYDVAKVINRVRATAPGGTEQEAFDSTSESDYFTRDREYQTLHSSDAGALAFAQAIVAKYKQPVLEPPTLSIEPSRHESLWLPALTVDLSDRILILRRPQGGAVRAYPCYVEGISEVCDLDPNSAFKWQTTFALSLV